MASTLFTDNETLFNQDAFSQKTQVLAEAYFRLETLKNLGPQKYSEILDYEIYVIQLEKELRNMISSSRSNIQVKF